MQPAAWYFGVAFVLLLSGPGSVLAQRRRLAATDTTTQAGCDCLAWRYTANASSSAVKQDGCANPDEDPKGAWCPVDPKQCPGRYGTYTWQGKAVAYDYCGKVRATTENGCLCLAESQGVAKQGDGFGKTYQDTCFTDGGSFFCYVATATCKKPLTGFGKANGYDTCTKVPADKSGVPEGTETTQGGCKCASKWTYHPTSNPSDELGPFTGCANPGKDPKGSWCVVSTDCKTAYGTYTDGFANKEYKYSYCGDVLETTQAGCMCKPEWGGGKQKDRCANPEGKATVYCEFIPGTCKNTPFGTTWDYCGTLPAGLIPPKSNSSSLPPAPLVVVVPSGNSSSESSSKGKSSGKSDKGINKVILLVPLLTGIAALVTICYTLYKCHKKRQFFKSASLLKLAAAVNDKASPSNPAMDPPPVAGAPATGHPISKSTV